MSRLLAEERPQRKCCRGVRMREFKIVFVFVCFLSLLGCAVSKVDATKMDVSAIQFSERLVKEIK